jgi:FixJ family two-component response regulator
MNVPGVRVAVVDDDPSVRRALQRILKVLGVRVAGYESGEEFLASLQSARPDCVVLDLHMAGLSGLEVQEQLSRLEARLPVVMVTGHHEPGMRRRCLAAGASVYLRKPIDGEVLRRAIDQAIMARS